MSFNSERDGSGKVRAVSDDSQTSVTRVSPSRRALGSKEMRELMDRLSAQQASLARSVALMDAEYLVHSYYLDPKTGKRIAHELEPNEIAGFVASWGVAPRRSWLTVALLPRQLRVTCVRRLSTNGL